MSAGPGGFSPPRPTFDQERRYPHPGVGSSPTGGIRGGFSSVVAGLGAWLDTSLDRSRKPDISQLETTGRRRRLVWLAIAAALTVLAIYEVAVHDLGPVPIVVFGSLPDLSLLAGIGQPHEPGQRPPRAVPGYNLAHSLSPVALIAVALAALLAIRVQTATPQEFEAARHVPLIGYVAGVAWLAHVALGRALGFGLRTASGWQRDASHR
jgi:hypothetical protein